MAAVQEVLHWISYAEPVHRTSGRLIVAAPNAFIRDRILQGQPDAMLEIARRADPELQSIEIIVDTRLHPPAPELPRRSAANLSPWPSAFFDPHSARPRMRFDRFVPGRSNVHAVRAAEHLAEAPEPKYHSVFIHGDIGTGKTHIRHAIARRFRECHPGRTVLSKTSDEFWAEYGRACRESLGQAFRDRCSQVDLLVIDDLQLLGGRPGTQRQILALLDLLIESGRRVAAFGDRPLRTLTGVDPRIITRLSGGPTAKLYKPDVETRFTILKDLAEQLGGAQSGIVWHDDALRYVAEEASPDCRDLEGCILQLVSAVEPLQLEVHPGAGKACPAASLSGSQSTVQRRGSTQAPRQVFRR